MEPASKPGREPLRQIQPAVNGSVHDDLSLDISVDAHPTHAVMPKEAPGRMMDKCAVVVPRRVLNPCFTGGEIFFGMQEPIAVK